MIEIKSLKMLRVQASCVDKLGIALGWDTPDPAKRRDYDQGKNVIGEIGRRS